MKKFFILSVVLSTVLMAGAYDINSYRNAAQQQNNAIVDKTNITQPEMREIKNLNEYFRYLPHEVNRNWIPYKADAGYQVKVRFRIHRDGSISEIKIVKSTNPKADTSVLNAVKNGAPYQPLPKSYSAKSVVAEIELEYQK